jgi:hypothetical protein
MARQGVEHEDAINEWIKAFEKLPEDRQEKLKKWFATQKIIIENSGLSPEQWFGYIEWAMDHPFDYSFVKDFPDKPEEQGADSAARRDETRSAREMVGADAPKTPLASGEGVAEKAKSEKKLERELFDEFMKNRLGGGGGRR